jgi:hypothetical protein
MTFDYGNSSDMSAYAHPGGMVVVGRNFTDTAAIDRMQAGGGEVLMYVDVVDGLPDRTTATGDQAALYGGAHMDPAYMWSPRRYNWQDWPMADMRPGSPWILHAVSVIQGWFPRTHANGLFLDVVGARLWTSAWSQMSTDERQAWTAGNADFVHRLRQALPGAILVANNVWSGGNPDLNGICVEHHPMSDAPYWSGMTGRGDWHQPTRNIAIATSVAEAQAWAGVAGVTHVTAQVDYGPMVAPVLPFSAIPGALLPTPALSVPAPVSPPVRTAPPASTPAPAATAAKGTSSAPTPARGASPTPSPTASTRTSPTATAAARRSAAKRPSARQRQIRRARALAHRRHRIRAIAARRRVALARRATARSSTAARR